MRGLPMARLTKHADRRRWQMRVLALGVTALLVALVGCNSSSVTRVSSGHGALPPNYTKPTAVIPSGLSPSARAQAQIDATVTWDVDHMTLDEKIGQMFLIETTYQNYNSDTDA